MENRVEDLGKEQSIKGAFWIFDYKKMLNPDVYGFKKKYSAKF